MMVSLYYSSHRQTEAGLGRDHDRYLQANQKQIHEWSIFIKSSLGVNALFTATRLNCELESKSAKNERSKTKEGLIYLQLLFLCEMWTRSTQFSTIGIDIRADSHCSFEACQPNETETTKERLWKISALDTESGR